MLLPWTLNSHSDLCTSQPTLTSDLAPLLAFLQVGVNWSSCIQKIKPKSRTTNSKTSHNDCPLPAQNTKKKKHKNEIKVLAKGGGQRIMH